MRNLKKLISKIDWVSTLFLIFVPVATVILVPTYFYLEGLQFGVIVLAVAYYFITLLGISGGYHRLFSHKSYEANSLVKLFYLLIGAGAFQNSALKWSLDHRYHHKYVDAEGDPYSINKGFWHAHMGWMFIKQQKGDAKKFATDLLNDKLVMWQHRNYVLLAILMSFGLPTLIGWSLGSPLGGLALGGFLRLTLSFQSTFLINSLCHFWGRQPYTDENTAKDSLLCALLTNGEGYHNFHHMFQHDYRNGCRWYQWDPTKWFIRSMTWVGVAKKLKTASNEQIRIAKMRMAEKRLKKTHSIQFDSLSEKIDEFRIKVDAQQKKFLQLKAQYKKFKSEKSDQGRLKLAELKLEMRLAKEEAQRSYENWKICMQAAYKLGHLQGA